jgi:hypothetical protein
MSSGLNSDSQMLEMNDPIGNGTSIRNDADASNFPVDSVGLGA